MCIVNKYHGGLEAVNQLWGEFVLEMKDRWESNCEIKGYLFIIFETQWKLREWLILKWCIKQEDFYHLIVINDPSFLNLII